MQAILKTIITIEKFHPFKMGILKNLPIFCSQKVFKIEILDFRNFQNSEILPWNICMTLMSLSYHCVYSLVGRNAISRWIYSQTAFLLLSCHLEFSRSSHRKLLLREVDKWSNAEKMVQWFSWFLLKNGIIYMIYVWFWVLVILWWCTYIALPLKLVRIASK